VKDSRYTSLYFPDRADYERVKREAAKAGLSFNAYVLQRLSVQNA
jgi:predicted HicB family RNase H-like nuclease